MNAIVALVLFVLSSQLTFAADRIVTSPLEGKSVHLGEGRYFYKGELVLNRNEISGAGPRTELVAYDSSSVVILKNNVRLENLSIRSPRSTQRSQRDRDCTLLARGANNVLIRNITASGAAGCGIMIADAVSVTVISATIHDTLADGIHITDGSSDIHITESTIYQTGDDAIGIVSYERNGRPTTHVDVANNRISGNLWGRGIAVVGGSNIRVVNNTVTCGQEISGLLVATEAHYKTMGVTSVELRDNTLIRCGRRAFSQGAITVHGGYRPVTNITIANNRIISPTFIPVSAFGPYLDHSGLILHNNRVQ